MEFQFKADAFTMAKGVSWDDVVLKIEHEFKRATQKFIAPPGLAPTFVLHQRWYPQSIATAYNEVAAKEKVTNMHTYLSFGASQSFGNHKDTMDVLIVQAIGSVSYIIDGSETYKLSPGDAIWIPQGVWHSPVIEEPRVTFSFSWD